MTWDLCGCKRRHSMAVKMKIEENDEKKKKNAQTSVSGDNEDEKLWL